MSNEALKQRVDKLESIVQDLTKENKALKDVNQELLQRVLAIEKKVGINYTPTQPKEEINKPKEQAPAIAKPKFEEKKTIQSKWPPKKDDSDSDEGKASDKKAVKFVPESTKKKEESQRSTVATSTFTGNTGNAGNKNIEYNISTEKLLVPSHGGGVYVPQQPSEIKKKEEIVINEEGKELDKTLKIISDKAQVKFVTKWIPSDEVPEKKKEENNSTNQEEDDPSPSKKRATIAVSNPTQFVSELTKAVASSFNVNWKKGDFTQIKNLDKTQRSGVTDIKMDLSGANGSDYLNVLSTLAQFPNLQNLELTGMFVDTKDVVASLTSGISQWGKLQTLKVQNIKGGAFDVNNATKLTEAIRNARSLKDLRISCRSLAPDVELQLKTVEKLAGKFQIWAV